jgi:hypothetical protein
MPHALQEYVSYSAIFIEGIKMSYNTVGVVPVNSYNEALARYENVKPIRGTTVRPLGARRYHGRSDITIAENRVFLNYYQQAFVEWHSDDTFIVYPPKYNSAFMIGDLTPYLPLNMWVEWDAGRYVVTIREDSKARKYFIDQPLKFHRVPNEDRYSAQFDLMERPEAFHTRLRPHAHKKYMAEFDPFFAWCDLVQDFENKNHDNIIIAGKEAQASLREACGIPASMEWWNKFFNEAHALDYSDPRKSQMVAEHNMHDQLPRGGRWRTNTFHTASCTVFLNWLKDTTGEHWVKARTIIITQAGSYNFHAGGMVVTTSQAKEFLKDLVLHVHRNECFKRTKTKDGEVPSKRNYEYFNGFYFSMEKPLAQG